MTRKRLLLGLGAAALGAAGFFGYRALGDWLTRQMTGKVKPPETAAAPVPAQTAPDGDAAAKVSDAVSGLDLIVQSAAKAPSDPALARAQADAVRKAGLSLVDSLRPLLNDPAVTSRLTPQQAQQYQQLMSLLDHAEAAAKSNGPVDMKQLAAEARKAQQMSLSLMSQVSQEKPQK